MAEGIVLKSASFEPGGEEGRKMNLETTMEKAGFEVETKPEPEEESDEGLTVEQRFEKNIKNYNAQAQAARRRYADFKEVVDQDIHIGVGVQLAMYEQENGAEVAYYLGKHPALAKKLGQMSKTPGREIAAIREVERLSARLAANAPRTQAPQRRPTRPPADASFSEIAAMPSYPGKARDLRRAQYRR
jgi:hypothetical protein